MTMWYVSDSFTVNPFVNAAWHFTGPANMEHTWAQSSPVTVEWDAGEFGAVAFGSDLLQGFNADVFLCLYDLSNIVGGIAQPVLVAGQPVILKFLTSTGAAMGDGILMNGVHRYGQYARAARALKDPISLGGVTTPATGGPFQIGALMRFFGGDSVMSYQYFMQGRVMGTPPPPPPPPPPVATEFALITPNGTWKWPVTVV